MTNHQRYRPPTRAELGAEAARLLGMIAESAPRVHCLTNSVAEPITANTLLALGAVPSLTADPEELPDFLASADALMVNLGTPSPERRAARRLAAENAIESGMPWVLDPVFADRSDARHREAVHLLCQGPSLVRANGKEIAALADTLSSFDGLVAWTGAVDLVRQGPRALAVEGGHPYLARVTAVGCALSAALAAFLVTSRDDPFRGVVCGLASFAAAGAIAGKRSAGPGGFAAHLLDALAGLTAEEVAEHIYLPDSAEAP